MFYYSESAFISDLSHQSNAFVWGMHCYYKPKNAPVPLTFECIRLTAEDAAFIYRDQSARVWELLWYKNRGESWLYEIAAQYPGVWHGDRYIVIPEGQSWYMHVYWTQFGVVFRAKIPAYLYYDDSAMLLFCTARKINVL